VQSFNGTSSLTELPKELSEELKRLSRREGTTLFMLLLAAFQTLLLRYTGQSDVVVGTANANRNQSELEELIGFFINMLPLRTDLSGDPSFTKLLQRVRENTLKAYAHQDMPFDKLIEELQPARDGSRPPLVQVAFGLHNAPTEDLEVQGMVFSPVDINIERSRFELTVWLTDDREGLAGQWWYNTDLFAESTIKQLQEHFQTLLESIVAQPDARLSELKMLSDAQLEQQVLKEKELAKSSYDKFKKKKLTAVQPPA
jgi:non-ribosomal peptide synthetase component F